jgi:cysteine desulfurase
MEGVEIEPIALADGHVDLERLQAQLKGETALVVLEAVCGETGIRTDTLGVRRVLDAYGKEKGNRIRLQVDASQAPLTLPFTLAHLGADMVTLDAQKVGGVRGIGALLMRQGITLQPLTHGGAQEHGLRPGTESPALALAFAVALEEVQEERASFTTRATHMRGALIEKISVIPHLEINEQGNCIPHILSVSLLGRDTDYAVMLLDVEGYAVSTKSACETDEEGSRAVTLQFGIERGKSTLRVSWGPATPQRDLHTFADALIRTVRFLDETAL